MSRTGGEGRAAGEKGGRLIEPANVRRERRERARAEEEAWAARSGPVEIVYLPGESRPTRVDEVPHDEA